MLIHGTKKLDTDADDPIVPKGTPVTFSVSLPFGLDEFHTVS